MASCYKCFQAHTIFVLGSSLKTNAAVHLKVTVNLLAAETFQPNINQSDCAHKYP